METAKFWMCVSKEKWDGREMFLGVNEKGNVCCFDDFRKGWAWESEKDGKKFIRQLLKDHPSLKGAFKGFLLCPVVVQKVAVAN